MFDKDRLSKLAGNEVFTVWHYEAIGDEAGARHTLGFFTNDCGMKEGDALYITGGGITSHHWVQKNKAEGKLAVWLFGG